MTSAVEDFFRKPSSSLFRNTDFVLQLESEMLYPTWSENQPTVEYMTYVAKAVGEAPVPQTAVIARPAVTFGAMGGYGRKLDPRESDSFDSHSWSDSIELNLLDNKVLLKHRIGIEDRTSLLPSGKIESEVRNRAIDGQVSGICLDMFRLLEGTELTTKKGRLVTPSINVVAHVCENYNFSRSRAKQGRSKAAPGQYPTLDEVRVKKIWRAYSKTSALWAAYRAGSKHQWNDISSTHLLAELHLDDFIERSRAFEAERTRIARKSSPLNRPEPIGPTAAFNELRALLAQHVPTYSAPEKASR